MKKLNNKGAVDFLFVAALIAVLIGAYFVFNRVTEADKTVNEVEQSVDKNTASTPASDTEAGSDENSEDGEATQEVTQTNTPEGWVGYRAASHGFSFAYPQEWGDATEVIDGPGYDNCAGSCGETLTVQFSSANEAIEVKGKTIDFHVGRGASDLNLSQKGYVIKDGVIEVYGYSTTDRGQAPETKPINGEIRTNSNGVEYVFQSSDLSQNQFISQEFDVSNVSSAIFNLPDNESDINGLAISLGNTSTNEGVFEQLVNTVAFSE